MAEQRTDNTNLSIDAVRENNSANSGSGIIAGLWNDSASLRAQVAQLPQLCKR